MPCCHPEISISRPTNINIYMHALGFWTLICSQRAPMTTCGHRSTLRTYECPETVCLWDLRNMNRKVCTPRGHFDMVKSIEFIRPKGLILTSSFDGIMGISTYETLTGL